MNRHKHTYSSLNQIRQSFKNEKAAVDLASIIVGVIVIGLIGSVVAATVFAVIPWAQNNAAKNSLLAVHTAESAKYGLDGHFSSHIKDLLPDEKGQVSIFAGANCYAAFTKSPTGMQYYVTSKTPAAKSFTTLPARPANYPTDCTWPTNAEDSVGQANTPAVSEWVAGGTTNIDLQTGVVKFNKNTDIVTLPLMEIGEGKQYAVYTDVKLPYISGDQKRAVIGAYYYAADGKTLVANSSGYKSNGASMVVPADKANEWYRSGFSGFGTAGSAAEFPADAKYVKFYFQNTSVYTPDNYEMKNISVVVKDR
jgi:uncharacterized protein YejL (UPF0352 family)